MNRKKNQNHISLKLEDITIRVVTSWNSIIPVKEREPIRDVIHL